MSNNILNEMMNMLIGEFSNELQFLKYKDIENNKFPFCKHINTVINDRINGLPNNFAGVFLVEESYYTINGKTTSMPHLFMFTKTNDNKVQLDSFELPSGFTKETFNIKNIKSLNYDELKKSPKFTPAIYEKKGDYFEGGSVSMFSTVLKFTLFERFSNESLEVSEVMEANGKRVFGYDEPIIYVKI